MITQIYSESRFSVLIRIVNGFSLDDVDLVIFVMSYLKGLLVNWISCSDSNHVVELLQLLLQILQKKSTNFTTFTKKMPQILLNFRETECIFVGKFP